MLRAFIEILPDGTRAAFEFRHPSWFDDEVFDALRARGLALCVADSEKLSAPVIMTADYATSGCGTRAISRQTSSDGRRTIRELSGMSTRSSTSSTKNRGWSGVREAADRDAGAVTSRRAIPASISDLRCREVDDLPLRPIAVVGPCLRSPGRVARVRKPQWPPARVTMT